MKKEIRGWQYIAISSWGFGVGGLATFALRESDRVATETVFLLPAVALVLGFLSLGVMIGSSIESER